MWATFVFSALLIAFFLERMASAIRERDRLLAVKREEGLRNERIVALGTMAVGAAHELGTPLTTTSVIVSDLQDECADRADLRADIQTLHTQIGQCKRIIAELLVSAGQARAEGGSLQRLDEYLDENGQVAVATTVDRVLVRASGGVPDSCGGCGAAGEPGNNQPVE